MAWGFWSASTVSDRGRSPRRGTTANSSAIYYQAQPQPQPPPQQCTMASQCPMQQEPEPSIQIMQVPISQHQQKVQGPSTMTSVCGSPCQSVCHSPTCQSPSCHSGTTGKRKHNINLTQFSIDSDSVR